MDFRDLIARAKELYQEGLRLFDRGDYYDVAEKGWCTVELLRKAVLVAVGVPYEKASNIEFGLPMFTRILKILGRKDLLDSYYKFSSCLHIYGFYEMVSSPEEIERSLSELEVWINDIEVVAERLSKTRLEGAVELMEKCLKLKRKILQTNVEYYKTLRELANMIQQIISTKHKVG
ncbi:MAG: PaREP1 family protein [Candidatus Njordarchaeota archaeon]